MIRNELRNAVREIAHEVEAKLIAEINAGNVPETETAEGLRLRIAHELIRSTIHPATACDTAA